MIFVCLHKSEKKAGAGIRIKSLRLIPFHLPISSPSLFGGDQIENLLYEEKQDYKMQELKYTPPGRRAVLIGSSLKSGKSFLRARLCVDYSVSNSFEAIKILRNAGFRVTVTPVSGLSEPELTLGSVSFRGLSEIQNLIEDLRTSKAFSE